MRTAYVLTVNENSERSQFTKQILETVGFYVKFIRCIPNKNKVLSNKYSMLYIYHLIANGPDNWAYVFEDDINILEQINVSEIIKYETLTNVFFYLGVCIPSHFTKNNFFLYSNSIINGKKVYGIKGSVGGLHAIGISKIGAKMLLSFSNKFRHFKYMDMILERFSQRHHAPVVRMDLESYIKGHRGIFFQDRNKFPSSI